MSLKLKRTDAGRVAPIIVCDHCGEPITDAGMAVAVFTDDLDLFHAHKLACHNAIDAQHGIDGLPLPWTELGTHLALLTSNVNADPETFNGLVESSMAF
ncbi:MAG: hypothetical protein F9B45_09770 [Phycisphaera sp. RhM]|nr:hypothetical protein [Phycisphaera sp. RhM]